MRVHALIAEANEARSEAELAAIEHKINDILKAELEKYATGDAEAGQAGALNLAIHRLEYLMSQRRVMLNGPAVPALKA